jgi:hypothetical protein
MNLIGAELTAIIYIVELLVDCCKYNTIDWATVYCWFCFDCLDVLRLWVIDGLPNATGDGRWGQLWCWQIGVGFRLIVPSLFDLTVELSSNPLVSTRCQHVLGLRKSTKSKCPKYKVKYKMTLYEFLSCRIWYKGHWVVIPRGHYDRLFSPSRLKW